MAVLSDYTSGTISLANGSTTVTGTGTLFEVTRFREGDTLQIQNLTAVIASVDSDTQLTLTEPWTGTSIVDGPYRARQLADGTRVGTQAATLIELLGDGTLAGIAALGVEEGKSLVGGPAGQYELVDTSTFGIQDPNGSLGKLAALTLAANKAITTDGSGNAQQIDLGTLGRALLALASGTNTQYVRADGTIQTLNAAAVGLGNVNNTSDADKPISTAQQTALNLKLDKAGNTGLSSSYVWNKAPSPGITAINLGEPHNEGPSGQGFSRRITHGFTGNLNARTWFEINHGVWHGLTVEVSSNSGAVYFSFRADGSFNAPGPINGTAKNFEIDHPADPDNYDLRHCATEAPEMLVEYRGVSKLVNGRVTVNIEEYFGVMPNTFKNLWADARVHALQNQNGFARVRPSPVDGVTFEIISEDENCDDDVAWLVMARRNDPYVRWEGCTFTDAEGRLIVEFEKPE